ncbi:MAG: protein jag [Chloroflexota bacterium]|nr:protein jag [Chloroflexota bacterium]
MESVEITGKTVDEAVATASSRLGIPPDRLDYTVVSEGSKGILGIGAGDAKIVVSLEPALAPGERPPDGGYTGVAAAISTAETGEARPKVANGAQMAQAALEEILDKLGVDAEVSLRQEDPITLDVAGDDLGILIGHRGETLTALQFILNQILNHKTGEWLGVMVDVEDYRLRREDSLRGLARRMADRARYYRQPVTLEPMPAHERRIVHLALQEHPQVTTHSIGEGEDRRVVITPRQ